LVAIQLRIALSVTLKTQQVLSQLENACAKKVFIKEVAQHAYNVHIPALDAMKSNALNAQALF
jgi:hypothetical protein